MANFTVPANSYIDLTTAASLVDGEFYTIQTIGTGDIELQQRDTPPVEGDVNFILFLGNDRTYGQVTGMSLYARSRGILPSRIGITERENNP